MGCLHSRPQDSLDSGPDGGASAPTVHQSPQPRNLLSRMTSFSLMTSALGRGSPRQNNVVPVPEGLFTGAGNAETPGQPSYCQTFPRSTLQPPKIHNTATVRSLVNLKKHKLRLIPDDGHPGSYLLDFVVDSSVPCRVLIYIMAYEKDLAKDAPPRLKSKHTRREPSHAVNLNGLEQPYCIPPGQGLPLGNFEEKQLTIQSCPPNQVYPVVIRIQALSTFGENGTANVQAQTTFATLAKQADGSYDIQVLKQVLWVNGASYVLHEIFGIDKSAEEESSNMVDSSKECVICLAETRDTLALPCRHFCLCSSCAKALCNQSNKCPICRTVVNSLLQIKLANNF